MIRDPTRNEFNVRPVQISFRNMRVSPEIEEEIRSRVAWLDSFHPTIVGCRVLLEVPHRHRRHGRPLHVRIEVSLPGEDVVVDHEPTADATDAHVVIHEAFDVARRRLEDMARRQRGDVKTRAAAT